MAYLRALLVLGLVAGCVSKSPAPAATDEGGEIAMNLEVTPGTTLQKVDFQIDGNGYHRSGGIDVSSSNQISARLSGIPSGTGYTVTLSATDGLGLSCSGSDSFDVMAGATTTVMVHVLCHEAPRTGGVSVGGSVNVCPVIDGVDALPSSAVVGQTVTLSATAHDLDAQPAALALGWTASAGTLDETMGNEVTFTCTTAGAATVSISATDGDCGAATSVQVTCLPPTLTLTATPATIGPGETALLSVAGADGLALSFSDGPRGFRSGRFTGTGPGRVYFPAPCNALTGGDQLLNVTVAGAGGSAATTVTVQCPATFYTTKTPYSPMQDPASYTAAPAGFAPVFTQLVARHGSRGLSSLKYDAAVLAMWQKAQADGALTPLGESLGPDTQAIMKANALLGVGVAGISNPGYGNLTQVGIGEHQQLAARLLARLPDYFAQVGSQGARQVVVINSGVDRAVDSSNFFTRSLADHAPALQPLMVSPPAPLYPASAPVAEPLGSNRFLLYFHKLAAKTDLVTDPMDPFFPVFNDSLAFQAYASNAELGAKLTAVLSTPALNAASRTMLEGLFDRDFVDKIETGLYAFANTGTFTFTSADGAFTTTLTGDGKTTVKSLPDAASMLYNLYVIGPAMVGEAPGVDLAKYLPGEPTRELAYLQDAQDFYNMGPGITEHNPVTYAMAEGLEADFFAEVDAIARGDRSHAAKLRFTHAEIIIPFASRLGLPETFAPVPLAATYTYESNAWRGQVVSPMAANVQWDVFSDGGSGLLVRMLYNEKEMDFKPACASARFAAGSPFYWYPALKACYGH